MLSHTSAGTLQVEPVLINLKAGEAIECTAGAIWATLDAGHDTPDAIDELLYPGDLLLSSQRRTYCLSSLRRQPASYRVLVATQSFHKRFESLPRLQGAAYTLFKAAMGQPEGALA